ncbi:hypothetical protein ACSBR1_014034 [Camellia fascicularis]
MTVVEIIDEVPHWTAHYPLISHLFFADDLLLFGKADVSNCNTIMEVLNDFSAASGLKISLFKSKLFISLNIACHEARSLSNVCGISLTSDLGKYLGIPLIHKRCNRHFFRFITDKIQCRLTSWKSNLLSLAGRSTLVQAVFFALPSYAMQTLALPGSICNDIDKLNRNFLWGDTETSKRVHLVKWMNVCQSKKMGGLGLRMAKTQNLALLAKLGWKILNKEDCLWVKVLEAKYFSDSDLFSYSFKKSASHILRGILQTRAILKKGIKWSVGDGSRISIWYDWWCGDEALASIFPNHPLITSDKVATLLDAEGNWDMDAVHTKLPSKALRCVMKVTLPRFRGSIGGGFSTATAYKIASNQMDENLDFEWVWKLKIPQKLKCFLYLILLGRLLTNDMRMR